MWRQNSLISYKAEAATALPHLLALIARALLVGFLAVRRFRHE